MTISVLDWISFAVGVMGVGFGLYQIRAMRTQRDLYREKCSIRYKDVSETVGNLTEHLIVACKIIEADCIAKSGSCSVLSANISAAMSLARELIRFCRRLDEEYTAEFHKSVDPIIAEHLDSISCHCTDMPGYNSPKARQDSVEGQTILQTEN